LHCGAYTVAGDPREIGLASSGGRAV
jgi:hypothetical protein